MAEADTIHGVKETRISQIVHGEFAYPAAERRLELWDQCSLELPMLVKEPSDWKVGYRSKPERMILEVVEGFLPRKPLRVFFTGKDISANRRNLSVYER
ncbi:uncharacterized protein ATNIH1004_007327 [Aspergillus tanneri]|uniref:Uncharacterized protein n=1 Tax=Aspergillus tanneri TaxID=1220188 RepID=A0A5M9MJ63_9EURO|nr:uncharacterized protein ATNIH1004_007327 [Aspergillus tanneri]KAA8645906.1 hypothetical protein ATNIH1004_007327 [Aspergillus tanneri]